MTEELCRLEDQVRRAFEGEAWHGPAVLEALADVSSEAAGAHPIPGAHSIWEIVLHLAATYKLVLQRVQGHSLNLTPEQDWPAVDATKSEQWHEALEDLRNLNREVRQAMLSIPAERLDQMLA